MSAGASSSAATLSMRVPFLIPRSHGWWRVRATTSMWAFSEREGSHTLGRLAKRLRRLERDHGPARFEAHVTERAALDTLLSWKSAQYGRTGMADLLARPWFREVTEAAAYTQEEGFAGMLSVLYAGDRLVAAHLGLRSDTVWHYWLPAHDVDPALAPCSPGLLLIVAMARHAES